MGRRDGDIRRLSSYAPACITLLALMLDAPTIHASSRLEFGVLERRPE
jgi:hypothetical protein